MRAPSPSVDFGSSSITPSLGSAQGIALGEEAQKTRAHGQWSVLGRRSCSFQTGNVVPSSPFHSHAICELFREHVLSLMST